MHIALIALVTFIAGPFRASVYEWIVHKYVLHNPNLPTFLWFLERFFIDHHRVHHVVFKYDHTYHSQSADDVEIIGMQKWWWLLILAGTSVEFVAALVVFFYIGLAEALAIIIPAFVVSIVYYHAYENTHESMHLPKGEKREKSWIFQKQNALHLLHHRFRNKNYNVVFPFCDVVCGTYLGRSPIKFKQAGPPAPNVQPLT